MECKSCYELFDELKRIPRNLPCGHTYCEICLDQVFLIKKKLECPECRFKVDIQIKPNALSKNFIACEIANKHREIQKKLLFCPNHKEPLRFFCETCEANVCPSCILDHNGHYFVKQDHSVTLLSQRANETKAKMVEKLEDLNNRKVYHEECVKTMKRYCEEELKYIDNEFDMLISHLIERKTFIKQDLEENSQCEIAGLDSEVLRVQELVNTIDKNMNDVDSYVERLEELKVVQGDTLEKELKNLEENIHDTLKNASNNQTEFNPTLPKVVFDPTLYKEIQSFGFSSKDVENPRICYFGDKDKVLIYYIDRDEWEITHLTFAETYEFNYYSSAVTIPNGGIIITGGGVSNAVCQIQLSSTYANSHKAPRVIQKEPMSQPRKEHASVYLQNGVYVLGGYNGSTNNFLSSCERFDLETGQWTPISNMLVPKCAFGATTMANSYIFTVGGYDGTSRLNIIERYDLKTDKWEILNVQTKEPLSNSACFEYSDNLLMILGGGHNVGFSLEMYQLNVETNEWKQFPSMADGKDLRNKVAIFNGEVYAIGGNNCTSERFSLRKGEWKSFQNYQELTGDNLDSWTCALYYDKNKEEEKEDEDEDEEEKAEEEVRTTTISQLGFKFTMPSLNPYQLYNYDQIYQNDGDVISETSSFSDTDHFGN